MLQLGIREGLLDRETVLKAADFISAQKYYRKPVWRLAKQLYKAYPERKLLEAVCGLLIRGEQKTGEAFYGMKGQEAHINITRLYEYFLYSLPDDYTVCCRKRCFYISPMIRLWTGSIGAFFTGISCCT